MISRTLDRVMAPRPLPKVAAVFFLLLAIAPEAKWRMRDPSASAAGSADLQTAVELGFYALVGTWAMWHILRGWTGERYRLQTIGPATLIFIGATLLILTTGSLAVSSRSLIRAVQYTIMTATVLVIWWESRGNARFFEVVWLWVRRGFIIFGVFATAVTAVVPSFDGSFDDRGIRRYGWMEIHPITTAGMLAVALLAIFGIYLGLPDRAVLRRWIRLATFGFATVFFGLLILTNSRGATAAAGVALVTLIVLTPRNRMRRFALLALLVVLGLAIAWFTTEGGSSQLQGFVNRGQTTEQVLSLSQRTTLFEIGMEYVAEKPVFGHGYMIPGTLLRTHFEWAGHAHNVALEIVMGLGFVGLGVFLLLVFVVIWGLAMGLRSTMGRITGIPSEGMALIVLILVQGVISDGFGGPVGWEVGVLSLAVLMSDLGRHWRRRPLEASAGRRVEALTDLPIDTPAALEADLAVAIGDGTSDHRVDLNRASADQLTTLPGVGSRIASRIVALRTRKGRFVSVEELIEVRGIGRITLSRMRPHAKVEPAERHILSQRRW
jgi:competence ComEA-like helix-hairpin-helix protein